MSTHISAQVVAAGALIAARGTAVCTGPKAASQARRVERRKYLVTVGGCNAPTLLARLVSLELEGRALRDESWSPYAYSWTGTGSRASLVSAKNSRVPARTA